MEQMDIWYSDFIQDIAIGEMMNGVDIEKKEKYSISKFLWQAAEKAVGIMPSLKGKKWKPLDI